MDREYNKVARYLETLQGRIYREQNDVTGIAYCDTDYKKGSVPPEAAGFAPFENGASWGTGNDSHAWFHFSVNGAKENTFLIVKTDKEGWAASNPQFIVYVNGHARQGMDTNHTEVLLDVGDNDIYLYGYSGAKISRNNLYVKTGILNTAVNELVYDIRFPFEALGFLNKEYGEYAEILKYLYNAVSMLDLGDSVSFTDSVAAAHDYLKREFYGNYCCRQKATTVCIGHSHIDCAWLWTLRQTREKVQRTYATVLELMKRYPEYRFTCSQALLYTFLKEEAPDLYEEVKQRVKEGRWEVEGAMWVEADCNLTSGESLVRQIMYGKKFFKDEFGVDSRILWLPDVFGYSAALPQILKKTGVDWFVTSKLGWNENDRMPYDTFKWYGLDGTGINTFFLTGHWDSGNPTYAKTCYDGPIDPVMVSGTYKRYQQKNLNNEVLHPFGYGDGGGGPTAEHLEMGRRGQYGIPGLPNVEIGSIGEFLGRLEKKIENNPRLPVWNGELYLEYHRGTYTSQGHNKRNNRKGEYLYQNAELASVLDNGLFGTPVPQKELHEGWTTLLTNQFHDIIPGSSIHEVYEQCDIDYAKAFETGNAIVDGFTGKMASSVDKNEGYIVFNPNGFGTTGLVQLDGKTAIAKTEVPSKGYIVTNDFVTDNHIVINGKTVETDCYTVRFDDSWQIVSVYDKKNDREVLREGGLGNELRIYDDYPGIYDAWEWKDYSREKYFAIRDVQSAEVVDDGARKGIRVVRRYKNTEITQNIWFYDSIERIDFETHVDWHRQHQMLKAAFDVDVHSDKATFEVQFGQLERPTHFNTSWDAAKFETCAHKYADLSDGGYGVSILNDCKYGYDVHQGTMQLSLLKGGTDPDETADQREHDFTYSLFTHNGTVNEGNTVHMAHELNRPLTACRATGDANLVPSEYSFVSVDRYNVICDTVKPAENGNGTVIRFYECQNRKTKTNIKLQADGKKVYLCDLLENELEELDCKDNNVNYEFGNFEIVTLKIK